MQFFEKKKWNVKLIVLGIPKILSNEEKGALIIKTFYNQQLEIDIASIHNLLQKNLSTTIDKEGVDFFLFILSLCYNLNLNCFGEAIWCIAY